MAPLRADTDTLLLSTRRRDRAITTELVTSYPSRTTKLQAHDPATDGS